MNLNKSRFTDFENKLWLPKGIGSGEGWQGVQDLHMHTTVHGMDSQWEPHAQHRELYAIFCNNLYGKKSEKASICAYVY